MFYNAAFIAPHVASLAASLLLLLAAFRRPSMARALFALLFGGACVVNWITVLRTPNAYLEYAPLATSSVYRQIILGPFADHIRLFVGAIATSQGLIALGVVLGEFWAYFALLGAIVFLVNIAPLGVGSAFPSTLVMAAAAGALLTRSRRAALVPPMWSHARKYRLEGTPK
ncbi:MAG TPA: hypothetical protein VF395_10835 [Polyangiaceae bacterium]